MPQRTIDLMRGNSIQYDKFVSEGFKWRIPQKICVSVRGHFGRRPRKVPAEIAPIA
jgi:hypothetical protein